MQLIATIGECEGGKPASSLHSSHTSNKPNNKSHVLFFFCCRIVFGQRIQLLCDFLHLELHYGELIY